MLGAAFTKVLGFTLHHHGDNQFSGRYCELERKGNEIQIGEKKTVEGNLVKILESLPRKMPVALVLSGKGIIHKNMEIADGEEDAEKNFRLVFPSIDANDFFVQQHHHEKNYVLSIARKDWVQELLEKLKRAGIEVCRLSFGGVVALHILPQLNVYGEEVQLDGHQFVMTGKSFQSYAYKAEAKSAFPLKVGQQAIDEEMVLAYAAAFQLLLSDKLAPIVAEVPAVNDGFDQLVGTALWKKRALIFLGGLFALLLLSFTLFSHFNQENEQLLREVGAQTASADQMDLLKQQISKQEHLLKQLAWNGGYNYGFLVNEIGKSMPRPLSLISLSINDFKTEEEKTDRKPNVKIKGTTANLTAVNNWIFVLREKSWVKSAKLVKFQEDPENDNYQFDILISY